MNELMNKDVLFYNLVWSNVCKGHEHACSICMIAE